MSAPRRLSQSRPLSRASTPVAGAAKAFRRRRPRLFTSFSVTIAARSLSAGGPRQSTASGVTSIETCSGRETGDASRARSWRGLTMQRLEILCAATGTPGVYAASLDGREIARDRAPFLQAARALAAEGVDLDTELAMRWQGSLHVTLRARLGSVATLTTVESPGQRGLLRIREFEPYAGPGCNVVAFPDGGAVASS